MTQPHLIACPSCARHVRASEPSCPFCKASVVEAARAFVPRKRPTERLGRAALYALGLSGATAAVACSSSVQPLYGSPIANDGGDHGDSGDEAGVGAPMYGAPGHPAPDAGGDDDASADADDDGPGVVMPAYGAPGHPLPEAGEGDADDDAAQPFYGAATDAAFPDADVDAGGGATPVYGGPGG
jgi:hypothetical protein